MNQLPGRNFSNYSAILIVILLMVNTFARVLGQQLTVNQKEQYNSKSSEVFISEVTFPLTSNKSRYVELYNPTSSDIDLEASSYYLSCDNNGNNNVKDVLLTGIIEAYSTYLCARYESDFFDAFGFYPDQVNNQWSSTGNDTFILCKGGEYSPDGSTTIDIYGEVGVGSGQVWDYNEAHAVRKRDALDPDPVWDSTEWIILSVGYDQLTPAQHNNDMSFSNSSGSWNTRGNWTGSDMGFIPDASSNVVIGSNQQVSIDASSACNQVSINENAEVSIAAGQDFQVVDSVINLEGPQALILNSDASGNSSLIHHSDSTQATVYSYFPDLNKWYFVASSMMDATAEVFYGQYLNWWDEPNELWQGIVNENEVLKPGLGYSVKKAGTHTATYEGYLNQGTILIDSLRYTEGNSPELKGWNLIGNPYPSVLDFMEVDLSGKQINAGISVWPHNGTEVSSYLVWSQGGGSPVGDDEARYIQPGQGFMIQAEADMEYFELTNSCRTHIGLGNIDKSTEGNSNQNHTLVLEIKGQNTTTDKAYFAIREGSGMDFDLDFDIRKMFGNTVNPHIFLYTGDTDDEILSINCVPSPNTGDHYYIGVKPGLEGNYQMNVSGVATFENEIIWIRDEYDGQIYELNSDTIINFY